MERRAVITGTGVVSPLGATGAELHAALLDGRSALRVPTRVAAQGACALAGELDFDAQAALGPGRNLRPLDHVSRITAAAAGRALADAGWEQPQVQAQHVGLVLGTLFCGLGTIAEFDRRGLTRGPMYVSPFDFANTVINAAAGQTAIWHGLTGLNSTVSSGVSAGLLAIAQAADLVRAGRADVLLAGGVEELCDEAVTGFARAGLLCADGGGAPRPVPFDARRNGFALAEGAAFLVIEERAAARRRGARVLGEVLGGGTAYDVTRGADAARTARAVHRAARLALAEAGLAADGIDAVSAGANGGVAWDRAEACGLAALFAARAETVPVTAVKALLGEALGAGGALQAVDALETLRDGRLAGVAGLEAPDPALHLRPQAAARELHAERVLVSAAGFDGTCGALVLGRAA